MFYYLSQYLQEQTEGTSWEDFFSFLRVFRYITFRSAGAAVTALLLSWWLGPQVILWLKELKFGQQYADKAEAAGGMAARVLNKRGTPTMGGVLIVTVLDLSALLWAQWNALILLTLLSLIVLAGLGFYDDYLKTTQQNNRGTRVNVKLGVQTALALFIGIYLWVLPQTNKLITEIMVPFYKYPVMTGAGGVGLLLTMATIVGAFSYRHGVAQQSAVGLCSPQRFIPLPLLSGKSPATGSEIADAQSSGRLVIHDPGR